MIHHTIKHIKHIFVDNQFVYRQRGETCCSGFSLGAQERKGTQIQLETVVIFSTDKNARLTTTWTWLAKAGRL